MSLSDHFVYWAKASDAIFRVWGSIFAAVWWENRVRPTHQLIKLDPSTTGIKPSCNVASDLMCNSGQKYSKKNAFYRESQLLCYYKDIAKMHWNVICARLTSKYKPYYTDKFKIKTSVVITCFKESNLFKCILYFPTIYTV